MQSFSKQSPYRHDQQSDEPASTPGPPRAPASVVNAIMGRLGLVREGDEPEGDEATLARDLNDPSWTVRVEATQKLGKMGKQAPLGLLLVALSDEQRNVRVAAARALGRNPRPAAIPALVAALEDTEWVVRAEAVLALAKLRELAPLEPLLGAARDKDAAVRAAAVRALGEVGTENMLEPLKAALRDDEDWAVREAATLALGQLEGQGALRALLSAHLDRDASVREAAETGLQQIYPQGLASPPRPSDSFEQWLKRIKSPQEDPSTGEEQPVSPPDPFLYPRPAARSPGKIRGKKILSAPHMGSRETTHLAEGLLAALLIACLLIALMVIDGRTAPAQAPTQEGSSIIPTFITYRGHDSSVEKVAWSPNGQAMASTDTRGDIQVWQASTGKLLEEYTQRGEILALTWSNVNIVLVAYGEPNRSLQVLEIILGPNLRSQLLFQRTNLPGIPAVASWAPDQQTLAFDAGDGSIQIWNVVLDLDVMSIREKHAHYTGLVWSPDSIQLATISTNSPLQIWNVLVGLRIIGLATSQQATLAIWISSSPKSNRLFFVNSRGAIMQWWYGDGSQQIAPFIAEHTYNFANIGGLTTGAMALSPDGNQLFLATSDGVIQARDAKSGNLIYLYTGHTAQVNAIEWSPDALHIATASMDTTVQIWQEP